MNVHVNIIFPLLLPCTSAIADWPSGRGLSGTTRALPSPLPLPPPPPCLSHSVTLASPAVYPVLQHYITQCASLREKNKTLSVLGSKLRHRSGSEFHEVEKEERGHVLGGGGGSYG